MLLSSESSKHSTRDRVGTRFGLAGNADERMEAFQLIYDAYVEAGLSSANHYGLRITPYHLLSGSEVFIAASRGEVFFTMSLFEDAELGLPLESIFPEEVASRRRQGLRVAEVGSLADRRTGGRGFFKVFCGISRYVAQFATRQGIDQLLVAVHPRHAPFYRRLLGFEPIGEQRVYPTVQNRPAVPLCLDFRDLASRHPKGHKLLFGQPVPLRELRPTLIMPDEVAYLASLVDPELTISPYEREEMAA